jgi:hypothetical protein
MQEVAARAAAPPWCIPLRRVGWCIGMFAVLLRLSSEHETLMGAPGKGNPAGGVQGALERADAWLLGRQVASGGWRHPEYAGIGLDALALWALEGSPAARATEARAAALDALRTRCRELLDPRRDELEAATDRLSVYDVSMAVLALTRGSDKDEAPALSVERQLWERRDHGLVQQLARCLERAVVRAPGGGVCGWGYEVVLDAAIGRDILLGQVTNLSCTEFALEALSACYRAGVSPSTELCRTGLSSTLRFRSSDGGFHYGGSARRTASTGGMTAAGVSCLALCTALEPWCQLAGQEERDTCETSLASGLQWLQLHFRPDHNPTTRGTDGHYYCYLVSLSRACLRRQVATLRGRDWYGDAAAELLRRQDRTGSWSAGSVRDTALAVVFLRRLRATHAPNQSPSTTPR